eukprot:4941115-Prorocentrum_lima.AAC.1
MTSSLVGSEMCIRDRPYPYSPYLTVPVWKANKEVERMSSETSSPTLQLRPFAGPSLHWDSLLL